MGKPIRKKAPEAWAAEWIDAVASGSSAMSARSVATIDRRGGGLRKVAAAARRRRVHLVLLEDDKGRAVVAASTKPFKVLA